MVSGLFAVLYYLHPTLCCLYPSTILSVSRSQKLVAEQTSETHTMSYLTSSSIYAEATGGQSQNCIWQKLFGRITRKRMSKGYNSFNAGDFQASDL